VQREEIGEGLNAARTAPNGRNQVGNQPGCRNRRNRVQREEIADSGMFDCRDDSVGGGTAGTANFWLSDHGDTSSPAGICH
jgi:hypothetical protein